MSDKAPENNQKSVIMSHYGTELVLDLHGCDPATFTRESITFFLEDLCDRIGMERCDLHFWDYEDDPEGYAVAPAHLRGVSAIQFITTSNVTIHTLDDFKKVFLNVFSCSVFDGRAVRTLAERHFSGTAVAYHEIARL